MYNTRVKNIVEDPSKQDAIDSQNITKKKTDKYNGFNVPSKFNKTAKWGIHIFNMIKEANSELLKRDDIRDAYNALIDCLNKYKGSFISWIPDGYYKYDQLIRISSKNPLYLSNIADDDDDPQPNPGIWIKTIDFDSSDGTMKIIECYSDIMKTYTPLYELIKRDVIPYMEMKHHHQIVISETKRCHSRMKILESIIKTAEDKIVKTRQKLVIYVQKTIDLQKPPKLTVFD